MSFDLCRLGCSIFDFIIDIDEKINISKMNNLQKIILEWCCDDECKNVLYKKNGQERYPNFKLYKMISRTVHKNTPENQLQNPYFKQFLVNYKPKIKDVFVNIDIMPIYT